MQEESEQNAEEGVLDLLLEDAIVQERDFEAEEFTLAEEMTQVSAFVDDAAAETRLRVYALTPVSKSLRNQLAAYCSFRTQTFQARRAGGSVVSASAEHDTQCALRFFGWMQKVGGVPEGATLDISFFVRPDMGTKAQNYCTWLEQVQRVRFTSICNYLSGLVSMMNYVYFELHVDDEVLNLSPNPLEQLVNLRDQAHGAIKEQNLYTPANIKGGWITWQQAQETRVNVMTALNERPPTATLKEACIISLVTLIPPDRVGVIRKLRFKHTLKRREGGWALDLTKRKDGHKTSKHCTHKAQKPPSL